MPGTRPLAIRSRALPVEAPQVPALAPGARRDRELLLRHSVLSMRSRSLDPVAVPSPSPRPGLATPTAYSLAHQMPSRDFSEPSSDVDVVTIVGTDVLQRVLPPPRTAPAAAAPRPPRPLSPRGNPPPSSTSIANSPRPRPSTRQRRSGILPSSDRGPGPPPPAVRAPPGNIPGRRRPGPGPRVPSFTSSRSTPPPDQCGSRPAGDATSSASCSAATSSASSSHSANSISSRRMRATMKRSVMVSSSGCAAH